MKIHHVAISVSDIKRARDWYMDIFELRLFAEYTKNQKKFCLLSGDNFKIELIESMDFSKPLPDYRKSLQSDLQTVGTKHFCYEVGNLSREISRLKELAVEFEKEISEAGFGGFYSFVKDLDGNLIEIWSKTLD